jgi:hypothetical protein
MGIEEWFFMQKVASGFLLYGFWFRESVWQVLLLSDPFLIREFIINSRVRGIFKDFY